MLIADAITKKTAAYRRKRCAVKVSEMIRMNVRFFHKSRWW